jgi:hypothetical protein
MSQDAIPETMKFCCTTACQLKPPGEVTIMNGSQVKIKYPLARPSRWAFWSWMDIPSSEKPDLVYLRRLRVVQTPWFGIYVHWINEADTGRWSHDHPWTFYSWVVRGGYWEEVWPTERHFDLGIPPLQFAHHHWSIHRMGIESAHKIVLVTDGLMTVVLTGKRRRKFRFWTPEGRIPWDQMEK